ncbi:uncharacterized protein LACBIDRAFT_297455 [Laccaria bicolor S238N-H82]|uniref:Predicted protein n=1 Tax=Laccaria bicolor (strain S238N-H82 / ATCC MYA-4686) TaxID=486041 RepID=B0DB80_LACBS|nr:uncharacterized protein LACBIDRAFT_297455 [Laccaria bicolor S238N-H82]EDR07939.1 predicted protein [Laccaria bicolor S238N-H82]|eukprot:XP_001881009.1 predicted protein [Laccaria bicolor S238N-H82]
MHVMAARVARHILNHLWKYLLQHNSTMGGVHVLQVCSIDPTLWTNKLKCQKKKKKRIVIYK